MKTSSWKQNTSLIEKLVQGSIGGMSDAKLSIVFNIPAARVSRWLKEQAIVGVIGPRLWKKLQKARSSRSRLDAHALPLLEIVDSKSHSLVRRFDKTGQYAGAWYRPEKNTHDPRSGWAAMDFEATLTALVLSSGLSNLGQAFDLDVARVDVQFAQRGSSKRDLNAFLVQIARFSERKGGSKLTVFAKMCGLLQRAKLRPYDSKITAELAELYIVHMDTLAATIGRGNPIRPAWFTSIFNCGPDGKPTWTKNKSTERLIRVIWSMERDDGEKSRTVHLNENGSVAHVEVARDSEQFNFLLSVKEIQTIENLRKEQLEKAKNPTGQKNGWPFFRCYRASKTSSTQ